MGLRLELFTQPSKFFPYLYLMRIKSIKLVTLILLSFTIKCYQLALKSKKQLELQQQQREFVLTNLEGK